METLSSLVDKLCDSSRRNFHNIYDYVAWPESIDPEREWCMSPELCSLYGTDVWEALDEPQQKRLAFYEAVNFFSLNIRGETALMQGLAQRLYAPRTQSVSTYLHHFLDEENKHCILFGTFCERYAKKVYPDRKVVMTSEVSDSLGSDFLFFAKVLIFEELVDNYNLTMSKDERLHPVAVAINRNHHVEEARHLAFGRRLCADLWERCLLSWSDSERQEVTEYLTQFVQVTWREYYNPDVYRDAGLESVLASRIGRADPWSLQRLAWEHPHSRAHRAAVSEKCLNFLRRSGIAPELVAP